MSAKRIGRYKVNLRFNGILLDYEIKENFNACKTSKAPSLLHIRQRLIDRVNVTDPKRQSN
jgi:hypothetical protein